MIPTVGLPKLRSPLSEMDNMDVYERSCLKFVELAVGNEVGNSLAVRW